MEHKISKEMKLKIMDKKPTQLWFLPITDLFEQDNKPTPKGIGKYTSDEEDAQKEMDNTNKKEGIPHIEPVTRGLALSILKNNIFNQNYNILIVHNDGKLFNKSGIPDNPEYKERIKCSSYGEFKGKPLVDIIKIYEAESNEDGKGLIILTGSKLRLGVSLPCVDIALNFDNVKSVDSNYQTMFRVLTERQDGSKKFGYYIDFNLERTKQFIYDYSLVYSNKVKKISSTEDLKLQISNIYELFNFNGVSFDVDLKKAAKMYQDLTTKLGLDDSNLKKMYLLNYERTFGKILLKYDLSKFNKIKSSINQMFSNFTDKVSIKKKEKKKGSKKI